MSAPVALVTGASGAVGPALVARLLQEGYRVRVLSRGRRPAAWPEAVEARHGDVVDRVAVAGAVAGVDLVFHLAGLLHVTRPTPALTREYERVNVEGARVVAEESTRAGVSRLVLFSTIAVYGPTGPDGADEDTPPRPDSPYAQTKLRAEEAVRRLDGTAELRTSVLRLAAVYGPRVTGNYARLARAIESGWFVPVGEGLNRRTLVHEADVAEAALLAARSPQAAGRLYNVSDGSHPPPPRRAGGHVPVPGPAVPPIAAPDGPRACGREDRGRSRHAPWRGAAFLVGARQVHRGRGRPRRAHPAGAGLPAPVRPAVRLERCASLAPRVSGVSAGRAHFRRGRRAPCGSPGPRPAGGPGRRA